jgi:hypothetical protein
LQPDLERTVRWENGHTFQCHLKRNLSKVIWKDVEVYERLFPEGRGVLSAMKKINVLFERHCHGTDKSEAIACARSCLSSQLTRWWTQKE